MSKYNIVVLRHVRQGEQFFRGAELPLLPWEWSEVQLSLRNYTPVVPTCLSLSSRNPSCPLLLVPQQVSTWGWPVLWGRVALSSFSKRIGGGGRRRQKWKLQGVIRSYSVKHYMREATEMPRGSGWVSRRLSSWRKRTREKMLNSSPSKIQ